MVKNIISENVEYFNGKRTTTQTIETITSLADDRSTLANYYGTLAALQSQLDRVKTSNVDSSQQAMLDGEAARIRSEMRTMEQAIEIQGKYIKGFEENAI